MAKTEVGRLALRVEGEFWNAYYARQGTMDGAILLGSIRISVVVENEVVKDDFMALMKQVVAASAKSALGVAMEWGGAEKAPEHERSGHS
jgi:hypothetical protein